MARSQYFELQYMEVSLKGLFALTDLRKPQGVFCVRRPSSILGSHASRDSISVAGLNLSLRRLNCNIVDA